MRWLRGAIAVAFLTGIALSPRLWLTNDREYPIVPVADFIPRLDAPFEAIVVGGLVASLAAVATLPRSRVPIALALVLALSLALFDQNRWQPWVYQYLLMLAALAMVPPNARERSRRAQAALAVCAFIVVAVYFWSGLSKVGAAFRLDVFPWLLEPLVGPTAGLLEPVGYVVPVIEMSIGLGLAWRRTRPYAVVGAFLMHTFILLSIGPLGHQWNTVVWPWNIAMVAFVFFLFWRLDVSVTRDFLPSVRSWPATNQAIAFGVAALVGLMPLFNLFGRWDSYLSSELYSGATVRGFILPPRNAIDRLPQSARRLTGSEETTPALSLVDWSSEDLNVPAYPARRVFKRVGGAVCSRVGNAKGLVLAVQERPDVLTGKRKVTPYSCRDLRRNP